MDGGPFRGSRPADRGSVSRPQPTHRQPEEPQTAPAEPQKTVHRSASHHAYKEEKSLFKRFLGPIIAVIVVIILGVGGYVWYVSTQNNTPAIDSSKYQAVFFTNGQVYFGKLTSANAQYMKLTDVYYLQSQQSEDANEDSKNPQQTANNQNTTTTLVKLGSVEIHGPEDAMIISKDQVLFYENLKPDGKVAKSIEQYKQTKQ